ncbi:type VI secretion system Vgr family protein [Burkholderia sp. Ax-1719]|uniref:type VI secretion system Vgr family protein n=1 Tax=Burkholderia sp. Ax-1719 TaxID=2608334 RepID=UPI0014229A15|nr:type VI secretion system Vgr family protein [Burkholderia sp. Ax-1719]NIE66067.1 type VI secretion system tip protein VgrG [Burkholderia sp. Ax-1719]
MNMTELTQAILGGLIQQDRLLKTDIPSLPKDSLVPHRAVSCSELGRDFSVAVDMLSVAGDIELKKLIAQPMTLWLQQADKSYRPVNGYIHTVRRLGADGGATSYQLTFASWMHFLKFRRDMRSWQNTSVDQIITDVFNEHPQAKGYFQFALSQPLPQRSYCRQSETDWNFMHRLMEDEGLFCFWRHSTDGKTHTLVITDDVYNLDVMSPETVDFYRSGVTSAANAFTQWGASRTLQSSVHTTRTFDYKAPSAPSNPKGTTLPTRANQGKLPEQTEVYEYTGPYTYATQDRGEHLSKIRLEEWESRAKRYHGAGGVLAIDAGLRFVLGNHPEHERDPASQREFVAIKVRRYIENNLPLSSGESNFPNSLKKQLTEARAEVTGNEPLTVSHADGSKGSYLVEVEAQRVNVPYRSPFEHRKPEMQLETAIVVGPKGEEVYTDDLNRVKVQFVWDRLNPGNERASCWIRVAQSDTGGGYGGVHIPRVGEEVIVGYVGGDCDRPLVLHRIYNGVLKPQWNSNGILSGYRSKEYSGSGYNEMVLDDATGQTRARLFSSSANSLLHLGYLVDQNGNTRGSYMGSGFDLRTDSYGAIRANKGLYVTTHTTSTGSQPFDASDTQQQLARSENVVKGLSDASRQRNAESLQLSHDSLTQYSSATKHTVSAHSSGGRTAGGGTGSATAFSEPQMLFGSPSGIGLSTEKSARISADQNLNFVSGESIYFAAAKSLVASVAEKISFFVQSAGMKLFAGNGKVEIQAQNDGLDLFSAKQLRISSAGQDVLVAAKQKVVVTSGGASITIENGNVEIRCPGKFTVKAASHSFEGPEGGDTMLPTLPQGGLKMKNTYNLSH